MVPVEDPQGAPGSCCLPLQALQEVQQLYLLVTTIQDVANLAPGKRDTHNSCVTNTSHFGCYISQHVHWPFNNALCKTCPLKLPCAAATYFPAHMHNKAANA
jgi:hypothetical protein